MSSSLDGDQDVSLSIDLEEISAEDLLARYTPSPKKTPPMKSSTRTSPEGLNTGSFDNEGNCESLHRQSLPTEDDPFSYSHTRRTALPSEQPGLIPQSLSPSYELRKRSKPNYSPLRQRQSNATRSRSSRSLPKVISDAPSSALVQHVIPKGSKVMQNRPKKDKFIIAHKAEFLALLPEKNRVRDLVAKANGREEGEGTVEIKVAMKPHQLRGLSFIVHLQRNGMPAILADEMGLGKTGQVVAMLQWMKENQQNGQSSESKPSLVVCPLSVLNGWITELQRWAPGLKVLRFHGPPSERARLKKVALHLGSTAAHSSSAEKQDHGIDVLVTTYETYASEVTWFRHIPSFKYAILDEGHRIKNAKSAFSKNFQNIKAEYRLLVTGTPIQNDMKELWSLLHWLLPDIFTDASYEFFGRSFNLSKGTVDTNFIASARELLKLLMIRRMKHSPERFWYTCLITKADSGLLENIFGDALGKERALLAKGRGECVNVECEMDQYDQFQELEQSDTSFSEVMHSVGPSPVKEQKEKKTAAWRTLMNLVLQLRKICNHPYLVQGAEPSEKPMHDRHTILASGKFILLEKLIQRLVIENGKKILVFSCFTEMLDRVEDLLSLTGGDGSSYQYLRLDGTVCRARRNLVIRMFNQVDDYKVMLLSTKAGGLGINLTSASDVVMLDQDWNPQTTLQAESRSHRIGQTKLVTVYKVLTQGTVEEQMLSRLYKKLYLSNKITESSQDTDPNSSIIRQGNSIPAHDGPQLGTEELMSLVRRGAGALAHDETDTHPMSQWTWEEMLERCQHNEAAQETAQEHVAESSEEAENNWLRKLERMQTRVFEGKALAKQTGAKDAFEAAPELRREDRRIGKHTTVLVDGYYVSKDSLECGDWEAVPTLKPADIGSERTKPSRAKVVAHQVYCQVCFEPGHLLDCNSCPRACHASCLRDEFSYPPSKLRGGNFYCPQHHCFECEQRAQDAGGMLYRCRCCSKSYCEDCLNWDHTQLVGESLKEFEILAYGPTKSAFFVECSHCMKQDGFEQEAFWSFEQEVDDKYAAKFGYGLHKGYFDATNSDASTMPVLATPRHSASSRKAIDAMLDSPMSLPSSPSDTISDTIILEQYTPPPKHKTKTLIKTPDSPTMLDTIPQGLFTTPQKRKLDDVVFMGSSPLTPASMSPMGTPSQKRKVVEVITID